MSGGDFVLNIIAGAAGGIVAWAALSFRKGLARACGSTGRALAKAAGSVCGGLSNWLQTIANQLLERGALMLPGISARRGGFLRNLIVRNRLYFSFR